MLERDIEKAVCDYARKEYDAIAYKFTSPQRRNVPDRIIVFPNGRVLFLEFKAPGKTPSAGQERELKRLRDRNQHVYYCDWPGQGMELVNQVGRLPLG